MTRDVNVTLSVLYLLNAVYIFNIYITLNWASAYKEVQVLNMPVFERRLLIQTDKCFTANMCFYVCLKVLTLVYC